MSGVRSWCEAFATNSRCASSTRSSRPAMSLKAVATSCCSVGPGHLGARGEVAVAEPVRRPRRASRSGARERAREQPREREAEGEREPRRCRRRRAVAADPRVDGACAARDAHGADAAAVLDHRDGRVEQLLAEGARSCAGPARPPRRRARPRSRAGRRSERPSSRAPPESASSRPRGPTTTTRPRMSRARVRDQPLQLGRPSEPSPPRSPRRGAPAPRPAPRPPPRPGSRRSARTARRARRGRARARTRTP